MGGKCCTPHIHGSIALLKEATQAPASEYPVFEAGPTLLRRACLCSDLDRDPAAKLPLQVQVTGYATVEGASADLTRFSSDNRQDSSNSMHSRPSDDHPNLAPDEEIADNIQSSPCEHELGRQGSGLSTSERARNRQAKGLVKEFVTEMVKGKEVIVVAPSGARVLCIVGLTRKLETLKVKPKWSKDAKTRRIDLSSINEILVGTDTGFTQMETPLDDFCVTLVLNSDDCVTFHMPDAEDRDTLAGCLTMFCNEAHSKGA